MRSGRGRCPSSDLLAPCPLWRPPGPPEESSVPPSPAPSRATGQCHTHTHTHRYTHSHVNRTALTSPQQGHRSVPHTHTCIRKHSTNSDPTPLTPYTIRLTQSCNLSGTVSFQVHERLDVTVSLCLPLSPHQEQACSRRQATIALR